MVQEYLTIYGKPLRFKSLDEELRAEHVLQRHRDVWAVTTERPFLSIDEAALRTKMASLAEFTVFSAGILFQNIRQQDLSLRLARGLVGPGTVASNSPASDVLVEGEANPQAKAFYRFNGLLQIGTHPFAALGTQYIAVETDKHFQRKVGEYVTVGDGKRSQPRSDGFDFGELGRLAQQLHAAQFFPGANGEGVEEILDRIFVENAAAIAFSDAHHKAAPRLGPKYNYKAGSLTRYGRLVHTQEGQPRIETSFALLHYEKALYEFDALKRAAVSHDMERQYMHGVYCVIAIASCLEAIANRLSFEADGVHPHSNAGSEALGRINHNARKTALAHGVEFKSLGKKIPAFKAMEDVRTLRNSFVHASEAGAEVHPTTLSSAQMEQVSESACRAFLEGLRATVEVVFDQLPWIARPIVTARNVKWLGDIEVP